jgi:hypothetical protein
LLAEVGMFALPPTAGAPGAPEVTGLSCPDCSGVLEVEAGGASHLHFRCRIGHAYSLAGLLGIKEQILEDRLWTVVMTLEELATLLADLEAWAEGRCGPEIPGPCRERRRALEGHAATIRRLLDRDQPLSLAVDEPAGDTGDGWTVEHPS